MNCSDRTRSNGYKLKKGRFGFGVRKKIFTLRVVRHCQVCPEKLEMSIPAVLKALSDPGEWKQCLPMASGLGQEDLCGLFNIERFHGFS